MQNSRIRKILVYTEEGGEAAQICRLWAWLDRPMSMALQYRCVRYKAEYKEMENRTIRDKSRSVIRVCIM